MTDFFGSRISNVFLSSQTECDNICLVLVILSFDFGPQSARCGATRVRAGISPPLGTWSDARQYNHGTINSEYATILKIKQTLIEYLPYAQENLIIVSQHSICTTLCHLHIGPHDSAASASATGAVRTNTRAHRLPPHASRVRRARTRRSPMAARPVRASASSIITRMWRSSM